jgi:aspartate aminotransferase
VIVSATLAINEEMNRRRAAGLATVPLGFGEAGLPVLPELVDRLAAAAPAAGYGPVAGLPELRVAAAGYWTRRRLPTREEHVIAGPGSKPLLFALIKAVDGAVALPAPSWVSYAAQAAIAGRPAVRVPIVAGSGGVPDPDLLDVAAKRAAEAGSPIRAVLMTLPDNPTGLVADPDLVAACCEVAERHDLLVISDEIYRDLVHDATALVSPAELAPDRTVLTTGLSKNLAVGGWRLGVLRLPDSARAVALGQTVLGLASEIWSAPAQPVQRAAAWAFTEPEEVRTRIAQSRRLHGAVAKAVSSVFAAAGSRHRAPLAAFYLYPDFSVQRERLERRWGIGTSDDLARVLLDELGVATLPGTAFGDRPDVLTLRVATSLLYGSNDAERSTALTHADPASLPWIAASLRALTESLARLVG